MFEESFQAHAAAEACVCMGKTLTYAELDAASRAFAAWLQSKGLQRGARVAIMMPNVLQYPVAIAGILRAGMTGVNVNPLYKPRELEFQLKDCGAEAIVVLENFAAVLQEALPLHRREHVVIASMGDMLGALKGTLVNVVVRHVKKMVPAYTLPGATKFNDAIRRRPAAAVHARCGRARRHRLPAIYRRHHRRRQGRHAAAPEPGRQCAAGGGVERTDGGACRR